MRRFGPGFVVSAAFIGPGTVTTASLAGAGYGVTLVWAVVSAIAATLILQEMSARLGTVTGLGLGEALRRCVGAPAVAVALVAIAFGNAAYQSGNLTGAALGAGLALGGPRELWVLVCAGTAAALLGSGIYRIVERALIAMVALMGVGFLAVACLVMPSLIASDTLSFAPAMPAGSTLFVVALVGTTVVPYNLFLHAAAARETWNGQDPRAALRNARRDSAVAVSIGGLVTLAILISAVPLFVAGIAADNVDVLTRQLEPVLGPHARWLFALGLFAAGLTSAITAPLAAAWATCGLLGWPSDLRGARFRAVWIAILAIGTGFALAGARPLEAIVLAQAANGILLPVVAGFLLWVMNRRELIGDSRNGPLANTLGILVVALSVILGGTMIYKAVLL